MLFRSIFDSSASAAKANCPEARFFIFNLSLHTFSWLRPNDSFSDTMDEDEVPIKDLADISHLLEFIHSNTEKLRETENLDAALEKFFDICSPSAAYAPKKRKKNSNGLNFNELDLNEVGLNGLDTYESPVFDWSLPSPTLPDGIYMQKHYDPMLTKIDSPLVKIQAMPPPKAKVFFKDFKDFKVSESDILLTQMDKPIQGKSHDYPVNITLKVPFSPFKQAKVSFTPFKPGWVYEPCKCVACTAMDY